MIVQRFRQLIPFLLWCITTLLAFACADEASEPPYARVEDKSISKEALLDGLSLNYFSEGEVAERWIDEQVLTLHAKGSPLVDHQAVETMVKQFEEHLTIQLLLDSLLRRRLQIEFTEIRAYYDNNQAEFMLANDAAFVLHLSFANKEAAGLAFAALSNSTPGSIDSVLNHYRYDRQIVYRGQLMSELDSAIFANRIPGFNNPIQSDFGYHLLRVEEYFDLGTILPLKRVQHRITERLIQRLLPLAKASLLDSLREVLDVEIGSP